MKVAVVGTGYVGLVTGTCFAENGNNVTCVDIDEEKVTRMQAGQVPIHEPGLEDLFQKNIANDQLKFTTNLGEGVRDAEAIFLALPTPEDEDGSADLSYILGVASQLGPLLTRYSVIVDKSTVPPGTSEKVHERIAQNAAAEFDVVSNPEFLREGLAVDDFMMPDRVVIGTNSDRAFTVMKRLYRPFVGKDIRRIIRTDAVSAEIGKYAANALLATKISFMNELSRVAEAVGADIGDIREIVGTDHRIGLDFLYAGPGWGGSCFPKDTKALEHVAGQYGQALHVVGATIEANEAQKRRVVEKVQAHFGEDLTGKTFALWGLAFKKDTDDIRESPALATLDALLAAGARVAAFDPEAMDNVRKKYSDEPQLALVDNQYKALNEADALIVITDWPTFKTPNFDRIKASLKQPIIFDGRNLYDLAEMEEQGFRYESIGRRVIERD